MAIHDINKRLQRTMNFGFALDAPTEGAWGLTISKHHLYECSQAGFTAIRLPVQWAANMELQAPFELTKTIIKRVDDIIRDAEEYNLSVVLCNHPDELLMSKPKEHRARLIALWRQLAKHYQNIPDTNLLFEPLSEPHREADAVWNELIRETLTAIRKYSPSRPVIYGPPDFNRADRFQLLDLPDDQNLIATFHYYLPIPFTMQGETYLKDIVPLKTITGWLGNTWDATDPDWKHTRDVFNAAQTWGDEHAIPIFLGEFGVSDNADIPSKTRWVQAHRSLAEEHGFSWGYWTFGVGFSAYNLDNNKWRAPVLKALVPDRLQSS